MKNPSLHKVNDKYFVDVADIVFVGDVHGKYRELGFEIADRFKIENSVFFALGDFGMGFHKPAYYDYEMFRLSKKLEKGNNHLFVLRGNHDDPAYFEKLTKHDNVTILPDYSVVSINLKNIVVIGGAISVDRTQRKVDVTYWKNEPVIFDTKKLQKLSNIDIVATHTAPNFCHPTSKEGIKLWMEQDSKLRHDLDLERKTMTDIYDELVMNNKNITHWFYGHFHMNHTEVFDGIEFNVLDELKFKSVKLL